PRRPRGVDARHRDRRPFAHAVRVLRPSVCDQHRSRRPARGVGRVAGRSGPCRMGQRLPSSRRHVPRSGEELLEGVGRARARRRRPRHRAVGHAATLLPAGGTLQHGLRQGAMSDATLDTLTAGREAFARHAWQQAYEQLRAGDADSSLGPEDLERLAEAARWSRHYAEMLDTFERAEAAFARAGDRRGAARAAIQLAWEHYLRNDEAVAGGWNGRAANLLENDTECGEFALLLMLSGFALVMAGNLEAGRELLGQARDTGRRVGNADA